VTIDGEKTYSEFARALRNWMDDQHLEYPMDLFDRLQRLMGKDTPSYSQCKMVYNGRRIFDPAIILFMRDSMNFKVKAKDCLADKNRHAEVTKINGQLFLPIRGGLR